MQQAPFVLTEAELACMHCLCATAREGATTAGHCSDAQAEHDAQGTSLGCSRQGVLRHLGTSLLFCWRQVYRGVLRQGGQQVAVKVQRPGVRESIALDIYILRYLAGQHLHQSGSQPVYSGPTKQRALSV